jgi:hypothetical protein
VTRRGHRRTAQWLGLVVGLLAACKVEPVRSLDVQVDPPARPTDFILLPDQVVVDEETSLVEAELRRQLSLLTSAYFGGRRPGTEGASLTVSHLERAMHDVGLNPAGVGGGWRQPIVVRIRATDDGGLTLPGVTAEAEPEVLRHGDAAVLWRNEGAGEFTLDAEVVDVGWGIVAPELPWDDYDGVDVEGKIVLVRAGVPDAPEFADGAGAQFGTRSAKCEQANRQKAAGCLVATDALESELAWQQTVERWKAPRVQSHDTDTPGRRLAFEGLLSVEADASLRAWLAVAPLEIAEGEAPVRRSLGVTLTTHEQTIVDPNLIGRIPGALRPEEVIVVLAHWDAGGVSPPLPDGGAAIDNAAGVAAMLAAAHKSTDWVRRGRAPARSVVFVATASDTLDLAGTRALLEDGPLHRAQIIALVELDALGVRGASTSLAAVGLDDSELGADLRHLRPGIRSLLVGPHAHQASELALERKIPAVTLTRHDPTIERDDVFVPGGSVNELTDDVRLVFDVVWALADSTREPALVVPEPPDPQDAAPNGP